MIYLKKDDKRSKNEKGMDEIDGLINEMNYELAGEIGVIAPGEINQNKDAPKENIKRDIGNKKFSRRK